MGLGFLQSPVLMQLTSPRLSSAVFFSPAARAFGRACSCRMHQWRRWACSGCLRKTPLRPRLLPALPSSQRPPGQSLLVQAMLFRTKEPRPPEIEMARSGEFADVSSVQVGGRRGARRGILRWQRRRTTQRTVSLAHRRTRRSCEELLSKQTCAESASAWLSNDRRLAKMWQLLQSHHLSSLRLKGPSLSSIAVRPHPASGSFRTYRILISLIALDRHASRILKASREAPFEAIKAKRCNLVQYEVGF